MCDTRGGVVRGEPYQEFMAMTRATCDICGRELVTTFARTHTFKRDGKTVTLLNEVLVCNGDNPPDMYSATGKHTIVRRYTESTTGKYILEGVL